MGASAALAMVATALVVTASGSALATSVGSPDPETGGVYLYNAGSDTQGFLTPPPGPCLGVAGSDPTNDTVDIAVDAGVLYLIGDEPSEVISFNLGADIERHQGTPDTTVAKVNTGLQAIDDYGFVGNSGTGSTTSDDDSNYDAQTGGDIELRLDIDGNFADNAGTNLAVIVPDGVIANGTLGDDVLDPFGNLDGNEIFIFEDAETSGMIIELFGPGGSGPYTIDIVDYQRNPDTAQAADDTLITIDLDSLPGFTFPYIESLILTDDNNAVFPNVSTCPSGTILDTSVELDAVATRTDTVLDGPPAIQIEKSTNGEDADDAPGPSVAPDAPVDWEYVITNIGEAPLINVTVADDQGVTVECDIGTNVVPGVLDPGESVTCSASGTATPGQYQNTGIVVGTPVTPSGRALPNLNVTDADPSHYFGEAPAVSIEKSTNGEDADVPTGPAIVVDQPVLWTYVVTNTGSTHLANVVVSDSDTSLAVDCGGPSGVIAGVLAPGASTTCSATGLASFGQYANTAIVIGVPSDSLGVPLAGAQPVTDDDPSHYIGTASTAITIEKSTNGADSDVAPGASLVVGEAVTWTYEVSNTGDVALIDVTVTDDLVLPIDISCEGGSNVVAGPLAPGSSISCEANGVAVAGQYSNLGSATGTPAASDGTPLVGVAPPTADDPSNYLGVVPGIDIEKATNGEDADVAPGPNVGVDDTITWLYTVANTGGADLSNVTVTDDVVSASTIDCGTGTNIIATLDVGQTASCSATGSATLGQYENTGTAVGQPLDSDGLPVGATVSDSDLSHYLADANPAVTIEKATNGIDADAPTGPTIQVGQAVNWSYTITNTGDVSLINLTIADSDTSVSIDCGNGTNVVSGPLAPGSNFVCTAAGTSVAGQYTNDSTVTADPSDAAGNALGIAAVTDDDPSHYFGGEPGIGIEKATNGQDADAPTGPALVTGSAVTWTYVVTNNGNQTLTDVTVTDSDTAVIVSCGEGTANVILDLTPGESVECTANGTAATGPYTNMGFVTGNAASGPPQTAQDPSNYVGVLPEIDVEKATNGADADAAPGPSIIVGESVTWSYVISNTGTTALVDVSIVDSMGVTVDCGGTIGPLAAGASVECTGSGSAVAGQYENIASVSGVPADSSGSPLLGASGQPLPLARDDDPSHYFGDAPGITINKSTNTIDADAAPGPIVAVDDAIAWQYVITNSGNVPMTSVTITDDKLADSEIDCGGGSNVIATMAAGAVATCDAIGVAVAGQYSNTGTVTGTDPESRVSTATDPSHYFATEPSVLLEKLTNGEDADAAPGVSVETGSTVTWTFAVTNTGNVALANVTVTDDQLVDAAIDCGSGSNVIASLAVDGEAECLATGTAIDGGYTNLGTVSGSPIGPDGQPAGPAVTDDDPSNYTGSTEPIGTIGDTVWVDLDASGTQETGELGIPGVVLTLTASSGAVIGTDTTDADGGYLFTGLPADTYTVAVDDATLPAGYSQTFDATSPTTDHTSTVILAEGADDLAQDFGYIPPAAITIEKSTNDTDADTEPGVTINIGNSVTWTYVVTNTGPVALTNVAVTDDKLDAAAITCSSQSDNVIPSLAPGSDAICRATGTAIAGLYTNTGTVTGTDPTGTPVSDDDPSNYTGVTQPLGSIGDTVWFDIDGDGNQQASEPGFDGVSLRLLDADGVEVQATTTDADGKYLFDGVPAGSYMVVVNRDIQGPIASNAVASFDRDGGLDGKSAVTLATGANDLDQDFGYTIPEPGTIGDTVWFDENSNGEKDAAEAGIPGVDLDLLDGDGVLFDQATTDLDGLYEFTDIPAGDYQVVVVGSSLPSGLTAVFDPDGLLDGMSSLTLPVGGANPDQDFGYVQSGSVGDFVFADLNRDGLQDFDEDGVAGAVVRLFNAGSDGQPVGDAIAPAQTTGPDGKYLFENVPVSGTYVVQIQAPIGSVLTKQNVGSDSAIDSDADQSTGLTGTFTLGASGQNLSIDAGIISNEPSITIEKSTNGVDADEGPGPSLAPGSVVTWTFTVTNDGGSQIDDVEVSDSREGDITCPRSSLAIDETMVCTKTGTALTGLYDNEGLVIGVPVDSTGDPIGPEITDEDMSHYLGTRVIDSSLTPVPSTTGVPTSTTVALSTSTPTPSVNPIAVTGTNSLDLSIIAIALMAIGGSLLVVGRRRRSLLAD